MTKFTDKALTGFPMAFYYAAMKAMDDRTAVVETTCSCTLKQRNLIPEVA